jgi:hypothetical protein
MSDQQPPQQPPEAKKPDPAIEAARLEELRFAKRQQWAVAIATITFIAGAFHMAHTVKPPLALWEKHAVTVLVSIVAVGGSALLFKLQGHLRDTRLVIYTSDTSPWWRGADIIIGLATVLIISAIAVCYSLWRDYP